MADEDTESFFSPPHRVTLSPFTPIPTPLNPRRLSSQFSKPTSPVRTGRSKPALAWVSLHGRLVGAEEATTVRTIGGSLNREEAVAWELFSPIHRVLIVAVVAAAVAKSDKNRQIRQLRNCVQLRDQVLLSMQQKLDDLCEQVSFIKDQPQTVSDFSAPKIAYFSSSNSICTDCWHCDQHRAQLNDLSVNPHMKSGSGDEMFRSRVSISNEAEQEERRMSDLSDWASSVTSAADMQLNNLAIEQDIYNLKRECEEKDAAIKQLSIFIRSKDTATSKRIEELEDIIRRKNTIITKLKKDMLVLEQKVVNLTRQRRRSFSGPSRETKQLPTMTDNLLYDMDSPTSPLSSDSDCSSKKQNTSIAKSEEVDTCIDEPVQSNVTIETTTSNRNQKLAPAKISSSSQKLSVQIPRSRPVSPLKEKSMNQRHHSVASPRSMQVPASVGSRNNRRRAQSGSKDIATSKRWV